MAKVRLDSLLAERGLFASRSRAAAAVMAGEVQRRPRGARSKPAQLVDADVEIVVAAPPAYVSRGGVKLANALDALGRARSPGARASTSAPRPAGSPTACCSAAPRG